MREAFGPGAGVFPNLPRADPGPGGALFIGVPTLPARQQQPAMTCGMGECAGSSAALCPWPGTRSEMDAVEIQRQQHQDEDDHEQIERRHRPAPGVVGAPEGTNRPHVEHEGDP